MNISLVLPILQEIDHVNNSNLQIDIPLQKLAAGVYVLKIVSDTEISTQKIIKQ